MSSNLKPSMAGDHSESAGKFVRGKKVLRRVFSEDYEKEKNKVLDPRGQTLHLWNKIFFAASLFSLFVDPMFFFVPIVREDDVCMELGMRPLVILTVLRSLGDIFYWIQIYVKFHTAYVAPSSRVFGRGELVVDTSKIAVRYLRRGFWLDLLAAPPLPQVFMWLIVPNLQGSAVINTKTALLFILFFQYFPRIYLVFPLLSQIIEATGVVSKTAWAGAAFNLMLFVLASHASGAVWFILSTERLQVCWRVGCYLEQPSCQIQYLDCHTEEDPNRKNWLLVTNITSQLCIPQNGIHQFGIYAEALQNMVLFAGFNNKYFYCLWWGLRSLGTTGQSLFTSTYVGETLFTIAIGTLGLLLIALLIGNMQRFLQSASIRLEQWKIRRTDTEQWMRHRQLPPDLKQLVREYDQYKWVATRGVDEETLVKDLPMDVRREIKRHLCYSLVRSVPLFNQMDETMLDAICDRLKAALCTKNMLILCEGDPVNQMLFIIRGHLESYTTEDGRQGVFNHCLIGPGDFCGEELLTWALDPSPGVILPSATRTVKAMDEVEAFALNAEDLKFVASQFRRLNSKQLRHTFRFYSHQWRTWAASFIQAAWRRHKKWKETAGHRSGENEPPIPAPGSFWDIYAEKLVKSTRMALSKQSGLTSRVPDSLQKPEEPDFSVEEVE